MSGLELQEVASTGREAVVLDQIPLPDYEIDDQSPISQDDDSLSFYEACAEGNVPEMTSFLDRFHPDQGDRQYGLELATLHGKTAAIRYLLEQGTKLHRNVFERRAPDPESLASTDTGTDTPVKWRLESVFHHPYLEENGPLVLQIVQLFYEFGWRPNQVWVRDGDPEGSHMFVLAFAVRYKPLVEWLLDHGADPNLGRPGQVAEGAACAHNIEVLELLLSRGARLDGGMPLHRLAVMWGGRVFAGDYSGRFKTAEWLVRHGVDVNGVEDVKSLCMIPVGDDRVDCTPLARACALMDWACVECLLDLGADPDAEGRMAFWFSPTMFWQPPQSEVNRLEELLEKRRK